MKSDLRLPSSLESNNFLTVLLLFLLLPLPLFLLLLPLLLSSPPPLWLVCVCVHMKEGYCSTLVLHLQLMWQSKRFDFWRICITARSWRDTRWTVAHSPQPCVTYGELFFEDVLFLFQNHLGNTVSGDPQNSLEELRCYSWNYCIYLWKTRVTRLQACPDRGVACFHGHFSLVASQTVWAAGYS